jgi:hypothetical protein
MMKKPTKLDRASLVALALLVVVPPLYAAIVDRDIAPNAAIATSKLADAAKLAYAAYSPGVKATNILRLASNIAEGETVTIGTNVYEYDVVNTDTTVNTSGGEWNNTSDPILVTVAAHGWSAGDLCRVESEIFKVLRVISTSQVVLARGRAGTAVATHADGLDIFDSTTPPASNIPVGVVTTLTPAVAGPALTDEINNALAGAERATAKASTVYSTLVATTVLSAHVRVDALATGANTTATTETLAGANNAWNTATLTGGQAAAFKKVARVSYVPTSTDVALDQFQVPLDFTPTVVDVTHLTTSTGVVAAWDGARTIGTNLITIGNGGTSDWATTSTLYIVAYE